VSTLLGSDGTGVRNLADGTSVRGEGGRKSFSDDFETFLLKGEVEKLPVDPKITKHTTEATQEYTISFLLLMCIIVKV
jgi:hypothetical protein